PPTAIDGLKPIATINIAKEILYITKDLEEAGIEFYLIGGYVRNRLLGLPIMANEDFDFIVNCNPNALPAKLMRHCQQNTLESKHLTMGHIDFSCEPWSNLKETL